MRSVRVRSVGIVGLVLMIVACAPQGNTPPPAELAVPSLVARSGPPRLCVALTPPVSGRIDLAWSDAVDHGASEPGDINVEWDALEPDPGRFIDPEGALVSAARLFSTAEAVSVTLATIQTTTMHVPSDLAGLAWDDQRVVDRMVAASDHLLGQLGGLNIHALSIGNEVDVALANDRAAQDAYVRMLRLVRTRVRANHPKVSVGVKLTFDTLTSGSAWVAELVGASDLVIASYYPLTEGFRARSTAEVDGDLERLLDVFPDREVFLAELGYPTDPSIGGSEAQQADFVDAVRVFSMRHQDRIRSACFVWLNDLSPELVDDLAAGYGISDPAFRAYLSSLGLRRRDGSAKPALEQLSRWGSRG